MDYMNWLTVRVCVCVWCCVEECRSPILCMCMTHIVFSLSLSLSTITLLPAAGMFNRTIKLLAAGVKPVYVFDGKPPDMKGGELEVRQTAVEGARNKGAGGRVEQRVCVSVWCVCACVIYLLDFCDTGTYVECTQRRIQHITGPVLLPFVLINYQHPPACCCLTDSLTTCLHDATCHHSDTTLTHSDTL